MADQIAATAEPEARASVKAWALTAVLLLFCIFAVIDRTVIAMLVDPIRADLGINDTQVALLMGIAYAAAYAIGGLPMGYLVDKLPRRWILYLAISMWGLAEAACGLATGFVTLFIARAAVGLFESPLHPAAHSIIADSFPRRRLATAMSLYSTGNLLGTGLALIIGGFVVQALSQYETISLPLFGAVKPWQMAFIATGLPGLGIALLILLFKEPQRGLHGGHGPRSVVGGPEAGSWAELWAFVKLRWPVLLTLAVVFGGMNIVNGGLIKWQPSYLSRNFHLNPAEYGLALGLITAFAGVTGLMVSGWIVDRMYARGRKDAHLHYYMWTIIITSPVVIVALTTESLTLYFSLIWVAKFATVNFMGLAAALVQLISPPRLRGRLSAIFFLMIIALLGSSLGPLIPAIISDYVLHDEVHLGRALAITLSIFGPLAVAAILLGRKSIRAAIDEAESWSAQPPALARDATVP